MSATGQANVNGRLSPVVIVARVAAGLMTLVCLLWNADVALWFGKAFLTEQFLSIILGLSLLVMFLIFRVDGEGRQPAPWIDIGLALLGLATLLLTWSIMSICSIRSATGP